MACLAFLLLGAFLVKAQTTWNEDMLAYGFGECFQNSTRNAYYYWKEDCTETEAFMLPIPVRNLDCSLYCEAGTYLDLSTETHTSKWSECPANTYNIGGGVRFSGASQDWDNIYKMFKSYCWTMGGLPGTWGRIAQNGLLRTMAPWSFLARRMKQRGLKVS
jgi:hypothetical protein